MQTIIMSIAVLTAFPALQSIASGSEKLTFNPKIIPITIKFPPDYDRLCKAIAVAETSGCTRGTATSRKNCVGIMTWKSGKREPKYFPSHQASIEECSLIWKKSYKVFPTIKEATRWTGGDNAKQWLATVTQHYYD